MPEGYKGPNMGITHQDPPKKRKKIEWAMKKNLDYSTIETLS